MGETKICYKCMRKLEQGQTVCPSCGYNENTPSDPMYIAPGTVLRDRYLIGVLLEYNGEGATYAGYDISTECRVLIREYMPINLCTRVKDKPTISVNYNNLAKYKAFMTEFTELNKSLARLRNDSNINPVLDMFAENNTTYTVFENIEGVKMLDYLKENAGELSWEQVSRLFPPLFTTIGRLHNAGIIHRAISPETVYITAKGELRLSGFCISPVRTADAGLEYELFKGYAAPEQYSASTDSRQGSWTDVYGICALIYRALTGCMPSDSTSRQGHDDLCEPAMLNSRIPHNVSKVIMDGMNLNVRDRIQTITELVTRLFEQPAEERPAPPPVRQAIRGAVSSDTHHYQQGSMRDQYRQPVPQPPVYRQEPQPQYPEPPRRNAGYYEEEDYRYEKVNTVDKLKVPVIIAVLLLAILMIIIVVIYNILHDPSKDENTVGNKTTTTASDNVVSGTTEATSDDVSEAQDTEVPDLVDKFYEPQKEKWKDYVTLEPVYEYNNDHPDSGMILSQEPEAGTMIKKGGIVKVRVSKGPESAVIPDYSGCTVAQFKSKLEEAGISSFNYQFIEYKASYGVPDTIVELQVDAKRVAPGTFFSNKEGKKLTVYYISADAQIQTTTQPQETTTQPVVTTTQEQTEPPTQEIRTLPPETQPQTQPQITTSEYGW
ncbi:MAG: PASTA domain-containing protein [Ruminococcus sp.]|nr:PASTA domain-containing protein [Ruminococcus sp.]